MTRDPDDSSMISKFNCNASNDTQLIGKDLYDLNIGSRDRMTKKKSIPVQKRESILDTALPPLGNRESTKERASKL